jgi:hypothetical protein
MRCDMTTHDGMPCARPALRDDRRCASHAGRCGARPGNRNALRHGLYSRELSDDERRKLAAAHTMQGLDEEIAVTRLMIARALRQPDVPPAAYARLADALCRQLRLQRQLASDQPNALQDALAAIFNEAATQSGLDPASDAPSDPPSPPNRPAPRKRHRRPHARGHPPPPRRRRRWGRRLSTPPAIRPLLAPVGSPHAATPAAPPGGPIAGGAPLPPSGANRLIVPPPTMPHVLPTGQPASITTPSRPPPRTPGPYGALITLQRQRRIQHLGAAALPARTLTEAGHGGQPGEGVA